MDEELRSLIDEAYGFILQTTNGILRNCQTFHIEILQLEDPSYEQIANQLTEVSKVLETISIAYPNDAEGMHAATKAKEYTQDVIDIARAIRRGNEELLKEYIKLLERRPFL